MGDEQQSITRWVGHFLHHRSEAMTREEMEGKHRRVNEGKEGINKLETSCLFTYTEEDLYKRQLIATLNAEALHLAAG